MYDTTAAWKTTENLQYKRDDILALTSIILID